MAISFKVKLSKTKDQGTITITRKDAVDLSTVVAIEASVYKNESGTATNVYDLTVQEVADLISGSVDVSTLDLIGSATPDDGFYSVVLNGDLDSYISENAGIGITLDAMYQVLSKQALIEPSSPDYSVSDKLMVSFMLLYGMDNIEEQDSSLQSSYDFTTREDVLKEILNYE